MNRIIFVLLSVLLFACKYDKPVEPIFPRLAECHYSQNPDSTTLRQNLVGKWKWELQRINSELLGETHVIAANDSVIVEFRNDGTYTEVVNSISTSAGQWYFDSSSLITNGLELKLSNSAQYIYGAILLCGDQLEFITSPVDGPDNLLVRIQ
jgi:hypothetical protein